MIPSIKPIKTKQYDCKQSNYKKKMSPSAHEKYDTWSERGWKVNWILKKLL